MDHQLPKSEPTSHPIKVRKRIVIFGETGTGKSSIVNMILTPWNEDADSPSTSNSSIGCTFSHQEYYNPDYEWCFYDTVGLGEGSSGTVSASAAIKQLIHLLKSTKDGIHLLVYVIRKGRITKNFESNYNLFYKTVCDSKVPIILVVTHCELDAQPQKWWNSEQRHFLNNYKMSFKDAICGCATLGEGMHPVFKQAAEISYHETRSKLIPSIDEHSLKIPWKAENWLEWVRTTMKSAVKLLQIQLVDKFEGSRLLLSRVDIDKMIEDEIQ